MLGKNDALKKYDLFVSGTIYGGIKREKHKGGDYIFFRMKVVTCNYKLFDLRKIEEYIVCVIEDSLAEFIVEERRWRNMSTENLKNVTYQSRKGIIIFNYLTYSDTLIEPLIIYNKENYERYLKKLTIKSNLLSKCLIKNNGS